MEAPYVRATLAAGGHTFISLKSTIGSHEIQTL